MFSNLDHLEENSSDVLMQLVKVKKIDPSLVSSWHVTASGILVSDSRLLLIKHRYLNEFLQPGGHLDPGETPLDCAIREVREETGYHTVLNSNCPQPIDIDLHSIPENIYKNESSHWHLDFAYRLDVVSKEDTAEYSAVWMDFSEVKNKRLLRIINGLIL